MRRLIADVVAKGVAPTGCIIGEPTGMQLVVAHKGKKSWRCRVRGHEAHSSLTPQGVNAVQIACDIVAWIAERGRAYRSAHRQDPAYDVPFTTPHVGVIRGGTALNIVPRDCMFEFEIRHLPFDDPDAFFADVRTPRGNAAARDAGSGPANLHRVRSPVDAAGIRRRRTQRHRRHRARVQRLRTTTHKVSFGSEAALFHNASMPAVICGPGHIEQAHQPNEWVSLEQLARCEAFMARLAQHLCVA